MGPIGRAPQLPAQIDKLTTHPSLSVVPIYTLGSSILTCPVKAATQSTACSSVNTINQLNLSIPHILCDELKWAIIGCSTSSCIREHRICWDRVNTHQLHFGIQLFTDSDSDYVLIHMAEDTIVCDHLGLFAFRIYRVVRQGPSGWDLCECPHDFKP